MSNVQCIFIYIEKVVVSRKDLVGVKSGGALSSNLNAHLTLSMSNTSWVNTHREWLDSGPHEYRLQEIHGPILQGVGW